jgi:hypothetical protein
MSHQSHPPCSHLSNNILLKRTIFQWQLAWNQCSLNNHMCKMGTGKNLRGKVKLSVCFNWAPRVLGEWRYISTHFDLDTRWTWVVSFTIRPLYLQGKSPWYALHRTLGGGPEPVWTRWWREEFPAPAENRPPPPDHLVRKGVPEFNWSRHEGVLGSGGIAPRILWFRH